MKNDNNFGRSETDQQYAELMLKYMEEEYNTDFQIVEYIFPEAGINSGMRENVLTVKDSNGVITNVKARIGTPYSYYDDYIDSCGADMIQRSMDFSQLQNLGSARLYAVVDSKCVSDISILPEHVLSVTLVAHFPQPYAEDAMRQLYDAYCQICNAGYQNVYLIAWFADGSEEFDLAVNNYRVYGKSDWKNYSGTVYAALKITTPNLSYEAFRDTLIEN